MKNPSVKTFALVALASLLLSGGVQRFTERRRVEQHLTMTDPQNKAALETGFLALGGFRGLLADVLWVRAMRLQDQNKYYELKMLGEMIQKLQPSFTQIHAYLAFNMSYNLAAHAAAPEDKWYWIRSGFITLEKGLERNKRNYGLWFEMGLQYMDRLGDGKFGKYKALRQSELANIDDLNEEQRAKVFSDPAWKPGRARPDEYLRWAAYYFYKASQSYGDPLPIRTERLYGNCIARLGHWRSRENIPPEQRKWEDWGAEEWWLEVIKRNQARGCADDRTVPDNLRWLMYEQIDICRTRAEKLKQSDPGGAEKAARQAASAEQRFRTYFPDERKTTDELLNEFKKRREMISRYKEAEE